MGSTTLERLELLARKLGFNEDAEAAQDALDTFRAQLGSNEEFALVSWIGHETDQLNFKQIAEVLNVDPRDVQLLKDNAIAHLKELMACKGDDDD